MVRSARYISSLSPSKRPNPGFAGLSGYKATVLFFAVSGSGVQSGRSYLNPRHGTSFMCKGERSRAQGVANVVLSWPLSLTIAHDRWVYMG